MVGWLSIESSLLLVAAENVNDQQPVLLACLLPCLTNCWYVLRYSPVTASVAIVGAGLYPQKG